MNKSKESIGGEIASASSASVIEIDHLLDIAFEVVEQILIHLIIVKTKFGEGGELSPIFDCRRTSSGRSKSGSHG